MAPNVREIDVAEAALAPLRQLVPCIQAMAPDAPHILPTGPDSEIHLSRMDVAGWNSDIAWLSQDDVASFTWFEAIFESLGLASLVAPHVAVDRSVVMYSGFFVCRSFCDAPHYHFDWDGLDNQCFTFLAPLSDNCGDIPLVYRNLRGAESAYRYRPGKGIVFGDGFLHSTGPGRTDRQTVMLSFSFGTDRMESYPDMLKWSYQGRFHRRPDGIFMRDGKPVTPP